MTTAEVDLLYADPGLVEFYDLENSEDRADHDTCRKLAENAGSVLDLGCGTGQLAATILSGRPVTGVDPAATMLAVARKRPGGERVAWIEADARTVRLERKYDLVLLTGHAFQCFLTPMDQLAVMKTIAAHLKPSGTFIFDTRNPLAKEWTEWTPGRSQRTVHHPRLGAVRAWNDMEWDASSAIATYQTWYEVVASGRRITAESRIAFPSKDVLEGLLAEAGLRVERWLGDWQGAGYQNASPEIIPIGRLR